MIGIGCGFYPRATTGDAKRALTAPGIQALVMGQPGDERHPFAAELKALGADVTRRHFQPEPQIDWSESPQWNADLWYQFILGGLTPSQFRSIYNRAVGPNEVVSNGEPQMFPYLCDFERRLAIRLQDQGIDYFWGSIAVGNIDPEVFATVFAPVNKVAAGVNYHMYTPPGAITVSGEHDNLYYALRPFAWWNECRKRGVRFPPLLGGESGTYEPWTDLRLGESGYVLLLKKISAACDLWKGYGLPVLGHCLFAVGAEGEMGEQWNVGPDALDLIGQFNKESHVLPNTYDVGPGVLAEMAKYGDHPVTNENYKNDNKGQTYASETYGRLGKYEWIKNTGEVYFFPKT